MESVLCALQCEPRTAVCLQCASRRLLNDLQTSSAAASGWQPVTFVVGQRHIRWCARKENYVVLPSEELFEVGRARQYVADHPSKEYQLHAVAAPPWILVHHIPIDRLAYCERVELRDPIEQPLVSEVLKKLPRVRVVDFSATSVTDLTALVFAEGCPVQTLLLSRTPLKNDGIAGVRRLQSLRVFRANHTAIDDFTALAELPKLREVAVHHTPVRTQGLDGLERLPLLERLDVSHTPVDSLAAFRDAQSLLVVNASSTQVGDDSLDGGLSEVLTLRELHLSRTRVTSVNELRSCAALSRLFVGGSKLNTEGLKELPALDRLTTLSITNTQVDDLRVLAQCHALRELYASCLSSVETEGIQGLEGLPLVDLDVSWTAVDDVKCLQSCHTLQRLDVSSTQVKIDSILAFAERSVRVSYDGTPAQSHAVSEPGRGP